MAARSNEVLLRVSDLQTHFFTSEGVVRAVDGVSLCIREGEAVGLVGESGCGKTMTARSIMRLVPEPPGRIIGGEILFRSQNLINLTEEKMRRIRGASISMVFQDPMTFLNPIMSIGDQVKEVVRLHHDLRGQTLENTVIEALQRVRIPSPEEIIDYYPHQLSGGMRQRVIIAIAISCSPTLLIADEPTTALDVTIQAQVLQLLKNIMAEMHMALLLITHDLSIVADICDRVYVMYAGWIVEEATVFDLFEHPRHPYTQGLLGSVTSITKRVDKFVTIEGVVPNLLAPPNGCRFHPRCPYVMPICLQEDPTIIMKREPRGSVACWRYSEKSGHK